MAKKGRLFLVGILILVLVLFVAYRYVENDTFKSISKKSSKYPDTNTSLITNGITDSAEYQSVNKSFEQFVRKWELVGASVAIAKDGKLIYSRGFGFANREEKIAMQPYNILRVASVSKLITATAVMKLLESGKLSLDGKVFGKQGILSDTIFLNYKDKRIEDITVRHLLNHSAGWTSRWGDHMFIKDVVARELNKNLPVSLNDIVVFALSKKLHFTPGNHSSYSNLGYAVLQLVIEKVSGVSYERFVQKAIFEPLNIHDAFLAQNWDSLRYRNEARYYEVPGAELVASFDGSKDSVLKSRGGNDVRTLGAAGGWVMSSISLTKLVLAIDGGNSFPDIILKKSVSSMAYDDKHFQPLGWRWVLSNGKLWRSGSLAGTTALAVSRSDGYTYVFIANTSPWKGARFPYIIDRFMDKIIPKVDKLPRKDLFYYGLAGNSL